LQNHRCLLYLPKFLPILHPKIIVQLLLRKYKFVHKTFLNSLIVQIKQFKKK